MRRKEKEITGHDAIEDILRRSLVCRVAFSENNRPYIVPLCFGYKDHTLYFHCAREGRKIDILRKNNQVCFEFDIDQDLVKDEQACKFNMKYRSVIGFGTASVMEDPESKRLALGVIMEHYAGKHYSFPDEAVNKIAVIKIEVDSLSGKKAGY